MHHLAPADGAGLAPCLHGAKYVLPKPHGACANWILQYVLLYRVRHIPMAGQCLACLVAPRAWLATSALARRACLRLRILQACNMCSVRILGGDTPQITQHQSKAGPTFATFQVSSRCSDMRRSRSGSLYFANSDSQLEPAGWGLPLAKPRTGTALRPCLCCGAERGPAGSREEPLLPHSLSSIVVCFLGLLLGRAVNTALRCPIYGLKRNLNWNTLLIASYTLYSCFILARIQTACNDKSGVDCLAVREMQ